METPCLGCAGNACMHVSLEPYLCIQTRAEKKTQSFRSLHLEICWINNRYHFALLLSNTFALDFFPNRRSFDNCRPSATSTTLEYPPCNEVHAIPVRGTLSLELQPLNLEVWTIPRWKIESCGKICIFEKGFVPVGDGYSTKFSHIRGNLQICGGQWWSP